MLTHSKDETRDAHQQVYGNDQNEAKFSHELIGGAAAFEGMKLFEDRQRKEGEIGSRHAQTDQCSNTSQARLSTTGSPRRCLPASLALKLTDWLRPRVWTSMTRLRPRDTQSHLPTTCMTSITRMPINMTPTSTTRQTSDTRHLPCVRLVEMA